MKITCISAANVEGARDNSASVHACEIVRERVLAGHQDAAVEIVPLLDFEMNPCRMCGQCLKTERCARDDAFNQVFEKMIAADGLFIVVPHYAPLPSKLMMLAEKLEEIYFINWCDHPGYRFPLDQKPAGVIGHGGQKMQEDTLAYYEKTLVEPVANSLRSVSMRVIGLDGGCAQAASHGVTFGIQKLSKRADSIFVDIEHDWLEIRQRIAPLVDGVMAAVGEGPVCKEDLITKGAD
jgi:multimeric flavodoxin WrbA